MIIHTDGEELQSIAEELGLEHEDYDRLAEYVGLVGNYNTDLGEAGKLEILREKLHKWIEFENETYYGTHETPADFAKFYFENYDTESSVQPYLVIDWDRTWSANLRHDFYFHEDGYVWAEVY
jgi:hypothetical protein